MLLRKVRKCRERGSLHRNAWRNKGSDSEARIGCTIPAGEGKGMAKDMAKALVLVGLTIVGLWAGLFLWSNVTESGRIDACLDGGGRWDYEQSKCEGSRSSP
jgi:hypothetical protein